MEHSAEAPGAAARPRKATADRTPGNGLSPSRQSTTRAAHDAPFPHPTEERCRAREIAARERRRRELEACGRYFAALEHDREPTPGERSARDTAIWSRHRQGLPITPLEAMRLPRLVPQPKPWVRELWDGIGHGGA